MVLLLSASLLFAASPPFTIDETKPADNDVVSQHPALARAFRDVVESYLNTDHDFNTGHHDKVTLIDRAADPTIEATEVAIWNNGSRLKTRIGTGSVVDLNGVPVGSMVDFAGQNAPEGWLKAYGQCVSRTTYADLFAVLGTLYDNSCAGTEFGIPDTRGRVVAGEDDMGGTSANRLTDQSGGLNGDTLGATGGAETHTLTTAQMPVHNHTINITDPGHSHEIDFGIGNNITEGSTGRVNDIDTGLAHSGNSDSATTGITATSDNTGSGAAHNNVQPTIALTKIIKF